MKKERDYIQDLAEIRSMMERSSKFLSLSGLAGVMAGIYALAGVWIAYSVLNYTPERIATGTIPANQTHLVLLGLVVLILAVGTAIAFSHSKANKRGETIWNATSKRLLSGMSVPLVTGGLLVILLISKDMIGLAAPMTLIFYGLALYNASKFSFEDVKYLGLIQIGLGLLGTLYVHYGLLFWAIGFSVIHIIYGIYIHIRYER